MFVSAGSLRANVYCVYISLLGGFISRQPQESEMHVVNYDGVMDKCLIGPGEANSDVLGYIDGVFIHTSLDTYR